MRQLAGQFSAAVNVQRPGWIVFNPRARLGAIEAIICRRIVNEQPSVTGRLLGERGGARCVDQRCQLRLGLSFVDGGVGGGIENDGRPQVRDNATKLLRLREIGLVASQRVEFALTLKQSAQLGP